jgi:ribose 5-phosphate isomerase A
MSLSHADIAKRAAAARALASVEPGMRLGLGSGSTAAWFLRLLGERIAGGLNVTCVATSSATARLAGEVGVPLRGLEEVGGLDLTVDGADEIDADLNLIKGGGAALLQEKIVAAASRRLIILGDPSKRVATLGAFPLPVEVVRFGCRLTMRAVATLLATAAVAGRRVEIRMAGSAPLVTDEGHHILDLHLERIGDPLALGAALNGIPGVVEHGLFLGMADCALVGRPDGEVEEILPRSFSGEDYVDNSMRSFDA